MDPLTLFFVLVITATLIGWLILYLQERKEKHTH